MSFQQLDINLESYDQKDNFCDQCPRIENYLRSSDLKYIRRPTVEQLHSSSVSKITESSKTENNLNKNEEIDIKYEDKFGMFSMVYVPTFLNLLGAVLYLRMGFITGECGMLLALLQVLITTIILTLTVLSMSAICSNGIIGSGGFYFLISRTLGPEIGAMFGCVYFLTNAINAAFSIVGVTTEIQYIFQDFNVGIVELPSGLNDQRIVGLIILVIVSFIPFISLDFEAKIQWFLFSIVILSMADFFVGLIIPPTVYQRAYGFVGWDEQVFVSNLYPEFDPSNNFFTVFSIFVSSVAGDFTGMTMSSTLKNPTKDIPRGSILAIITTSLLYGFQIIFFASTCVRYASGNLSDVSFGNSSCDQNQNCNYGLIPDQYIMSRTSALTIVGQKLNYVEPIFTSGLIAQSLSSAMSSFISAPRILQSLGFDRLLPLTKWFSKGSGRHNDPRRGYILTFAICLIFIAIANFNLIANIVSSCYLFSWSLLNIAVFHSCYVRSTNWRPTFKLYNKWLSLLCGFVCVILSFIMSWISSLCLLIVMFLTWIAIHYYKPEADWGQTSDSQIYKTAVSLAHKLSLKSVHVKNFRPSILVMCGIPIDYIDLIFLANDITRHRGMLFIGDVIKTPVIYEMRYKTIKFWNNWLNKHKIKCFYRLINANSINEGSKMMIQCCGLGSQLSPNIVMIGFKEKWKQSTNLDVKDYFNFIHLALRMQMSLIIYRNCKTINEKRHNSYDCLNDLRLNQKSKQFLSLNQLKRKQCLYLLNAQSLRTVIQLQFIDIYWLYDDGGLTLLIPYILSQRKRWQKSKLRIFIVIDNRNNDSSISEKNLGIMLDNFRIDYYDIIIEEYRGQIASTEFHDIVSFIEKSNTVLDFQSKFELEQSCKRFESGTAKYCFLRSILEKHSKNSNLIVMTIEIPRVDTLSAHLFMYWLDLLSSEMPEFLFIRGNQKNVLTYYFD